jgi:Bacterial CdiA-CT RNAse A domain
MFGRPRPVRALRRSWNVGVHGPAASPLVPGGGLSSHELSGGHTISRHIGKTDADLAARLMAEPRISGASSFTDRAVAERAVSDALAANSADIASWLSGAQRRMPAFEVNVGYDVGRSLPRGATSASNVQGVRIVLERDTSMATGYKIITAFPTP